MGERHGDRGDGDAAQIPGGDRPFSVADDVDLAVLADGGDGFVGRGVLGPAGDVLDVTVAETGADGQRLIRSRIEDGVFGHNLDSFNARVLFLRSGRARGDPLGQDFVFERIDIEAFAAFVRHRASGFEQEQAAPGIGWDDAASALALAEAEVSTRRALCSSSCWAE